MSRGVVPARRVAHPACDEMRSRCRCALDLGHDGPHVCGDTSVDGAICFGSWAIEGTDIVTYAWPHIPEGTVLPPEYRNLPLPHRERA